MGGAFVRWSNHIYSGVVNSYRTLTLADYGIYSTMPQPDGTRPCHQVRERLPLQPGYPVKQPLFGAVLLTFILQLATIYIPFLNPVFNTEPLSLGELLFALAMSSVLFFAVEIEKWFKRRKGLTNLSHK